MEIILPNLTDRPFRYSTERTIAAAAPNLYRAWTDGFERWLAIAGTLKATPVEGTPFFFETESDGIREPHYGRFLRLERGRLVVLSWVTAATRGTETVITIRLEPRANGTLLKMVHAGFPDADSMKKHEQTWPALLSHLESRGLVR